MSDALLVQPASGGRISGGYLYNFEMARHGAWRVSESEAADLPALIRAIRHEIVIMDSLWLTERTFASFRGLQERGVRLGALIHALPTRIAAAESGEAPPLAPSVFEADALASLDFVLVPGPFYARLLAGIAPALHVVPPGVDEGWRSPPRRRHGRCELVSLGAVTPLKGFADVLDALDRLDAGSDVRWSVAGSLTAHAPYAERLRARAADDDRIRFLGQRTPPEVRALVQHSHALVMPSYEENHPLVLLEAMAASVPCVAYDAGAAGEIVEHGVTGYVVPIGDRAALARHLEELARDEEGRFEMARACWRRRDTIRGWSEAACQAREVLSGDFAAAPTPRRST